MEISEFIQEDLEEVPFNQLNLEDVFSFGGAGRRPLFIRKVTLKTPDRIYYECIGMNARGMRDWDTTERNSPVTRIIRGKDYDPSQQPFDEDDI